MKKQQQESFGVFADQTVVLQARIGEFKDNDSVLGLLYGIAAALDDIASGQDVYIIIGATRDRSSFTVNFKGADGAGAVYGQTLTELGNEVMKLV